METIQHSACPLNCWDNCGLQVTVEDGKVTKVNGDPDHPITKGKICSRGRMLADRANGSERLLFPLKQVNGQFKQIPWNQALDEITAKLTDVKQTYGSTAVLHSHDYANNGILKNLDQRFFNCYGGVTEIVGSLCWGAGIEAQKWDFGNAISHAPNDLATSKNIIVWGRNAARTNMHFYEKLLEAKKRGATIYVIDPVYNATAKIANQYLSVKPGMDGFLAIGMMKEMIRLHLEDREFIETSTIGFADLLELINGISLEKISELTEVPVPVFSQFAQIYADKPTATYMGLGMQRYRNGGNTIRLIDALVAISGNIGIPGGGANYANIQVGQSFSFEQLTLPNRRQRHRQFPIMHQAEEVLAAADPPIKMIFVTCGNPLTQLPNTSIAEKAFSSVETLVVMDSYMTDTAKLADYVLPVAVSFEEEDFYYSSMYHHYVNYGPKLVDPPGEAKSDLWIWTKLAEHLGFGGDFAFTREQWMEMCLASLKNQGISLEKLKKQRWIELPVQEIPWADRKFQTPSGKYEFTSSLASIKGMDGQLTLSLPRESKWSQPDLAKNYPYHLLTIHPLRSNHSQHYPIWKNEPQVRVEIAKNIADQLNLQDGDRVRVWNERGTIEGTVAIAGKIHPDTIVMDEGISKVFGGSVNQLTATLESDNGLGSTLYDCLVNIEKIG
ncbi:molybdopterin-dependent oxidoreductase [Neobacillus sp. SM06]|uniref:molybdopterin-dependent oxidoreductase n=1 Tax=Neobacillus sp. SM06 TaxID=3422492 RepID=UPI003D27818F